MWWCKLCGKFCRPRKTGCTAWSKRVAYPEKVSCDICTTYIAHLLEEHSCFVFFYGSRLREMFEFLISPVWCRRAPSTTKKNLELAIRKISNMCRHFQLLDTASFSLVRVLFPIIHLLPLQHVPHQRSYSNRTALVCIGLTHKILSSEEFTQRPWAALIMPPLFNVFKKCSLLVWHKTLGSNSLNS